MSSVLPRSAERVRSAGIVLKVSRNVHGSGREHGYKSHERKVRLAYLKIGSDSIQKILLVIYSLIYPVASSARAMQASSDDQKTFRSNDLGTRLPSTPEGVATVLPICWPSRITSRLYLSPSWSSKAILVLESGWSCSSTATATGSCKGGPSFNPNFSA